MLYGVFSDIHSNYEAFNEVLKFYKKNKIINFICCGDIVGYGPEPEKCLRKVFELKNKVCVLGNHDAVLCGRMDSKWFKEKAVEAIEINKKEVSGEMLSFLSDMPERIENKDYTLVHGSPRSPLKEYLLASGQFMDNLKHWSISPCFFGHSHLPLFFEYDKESNILTSADLADSPRVALKRKNKYMLNPGSVGQPRDSNPKASCAIYDSSSKCFDVFRLDYDIKKTQEAMKEKNMPSAFADRLKFGL